MTETERRERRRATWRASKERTRRKPTKLDRMPVENAVLWVQVRYRRDAPMLRWWLEHYSLDEIRRLTPW